jgi:parvulin-like peptidyl-prolyl isomerase
MLLAIAVGVSLWASPEHARADPSGGADAADAVARVNGEPITRGEFDRMLANPATRAQLRQELGADPDRKQLERAALRRLIHRRLMLEEAARRNLTVTVDELDRAVAALRRRFDDLSSFGAWMKEQGLADESLFETVRADLLSDRAWASIVEGVRVTDEETRRYYAAHEQEIIVGEEVRLRMIAVNDPAAAEEALQALRRGAQFHRVARQRSLGLRAAQGGDTGWVDARTLSPALAKAIPLLKAGDVAGPLENGPGAFLVVGLEGRRPLWARTLAEARPQIERTLLAERQQDVFRAWLVAQEAKSKIELLNEVPIHHATRGD